MADETVSIAFDLKSNLKATGESDAAALERLKSAIESDTESLRGYQNALAKLRAGSMGSTEAAKKLKDQIAAQKASIAQATTGVLGLGGNMNKAKKPTAELTDVMSHFRASVSESFGPTMRFGGSLKSLFAMCASGTGMLLALAAVVIAVAAAEVGAIAMTIKFGLAAAEARREELQHLEGLTKLRTAYQLLGFGMRIPAAKAVDLQNQIDEVTDSVALGRDEVMKYQDQLYRMGLRGGNLQAALKGATTTAATQGDAAAQQFIGWSMAAAMTGRSIKALAGDVEARLGGLARDQMLNFGVQTAKLHENLTRLFKDVDLRPLLRGLHEVLEIFSLQHASGRALKALLDTLFGGIGKEAEGAGFIVRRFFQGMIIGALRVAIGFQLLRLKLRDLLGGSKILTDLDAVKVAMNVAEAAVYGMAGAVTVAAIPWIGLGLVIYGVVKAIGAVAGAFAAVRSHIATMNWRELGSDVVKGIVLGLFGAIGLVFAPVKALGDAIVGQFRKALDMHSPSRRMVRESFNIGAGAAIGVEQSRPAVVRASNRLAAAPLGAFDAPRAPRGGQPGGISARIGAAFGAAAGGARGGGMAPAAVTVGAVHVHTAATDSAGIVADVRAALIAEFEGLGIHMGAAPAGA